jgi:hypothetical protein
MQVIMNAFFILFQCWLFRFLTYRISNGVAFHFIGLKSYVLDCQM